MIIKNTITNSANEGMKLIMHDDQDHIHKQQPKKNAVVVCKATRSTNNYNRPRGEEESSHSGRVRAPHQNLSDCITACY